MRGRPRRSPWSSPECQDDAGEVLGISRGADPADPGVAPEPDPLAPGELAGAADGEVERLARGTGSRRRGGPGSPCSRSPAPRYATAPRRFEESFDESPGRVRARTSASRPSAAHRPRTGARCADRARLAAATRRPVRRRTTGGPYSARPAPNEENGRPVVSSTSSARTIRRVLPGSIRDAASGSARCEPVVGARRGRRPSRVSSSSAARTSRSRGGTASPSTTARTYRPVPPTSSARRPRASMSAIAACAAVWVARTDHSSDGSATSTR